ncbi:hypothetical protein K503DRAFT_866984 [Rhizopogon vinicolor AM-OR11-026]|uniref:Uncharacterized protein n=1 Tax=Rhizopogon vinicolor AM-OR11-026 TaxID=1314800 RepID=A0A1B7MXB4_9AGAM|nr:hypothetical protein K503DRAFT_866984 [Rhizopogon vinicolor AM-OR11-026]
MFLLEGCINYAWNSRNNYDLNIDHVPWNTKTLTLRGYFRGKSIVRKENAATLAFLASIPYVIGILIDRARLAYLRRPGDDLEETCWTHFDELPPWMQYISVPEWKALKLCTVASLHWNWDVSPVTAWLVDWRDVHVELMTYTPPLHGWGSARGMTYYTRACAKLLTVPIVLHNTI